MITAFVSGLGAGYGIAIPVGAIAILIVETGIRRGLGLALAAGAGAATADAIYALLAALGGTAIAAMIQPVAVPLRVASAGVLAAIAVRGLAGLTRGVRAAARTEVDGQPSVSATYARLVGLTLLNPTTVVYFAALILGLPALGSGVPEKLAFVAGAAVASLSWQSVLASVGSLFHRRLPARLQVGLRLLGNVVILGFALSIAAQVASR